MSPKKVVLMLSGGRDSFLSACLLLEKSPEYYLYMVTFDNGFTYGLDSVKGTAERIINKYGKNRAQYLGVIRTSAVLREFYSPYFNMKPEEQLKRFYGLTPSQYHCLICRTSMYLYSIWIAMLNDASYISEGARASQEFVIELSGMIERFSLLVKSAGMNLMLPVYELDDDWIRDKELISRGFLSKALEPKCLLGYPIQQGVDQSVIDGVHAYYDQVILPRIMQKKLLTLDNAKKYAVCIPERLM